LLASQTCWRIGAALCIAAVPIWALGRFTDVDPLLADAPYNGAARTFPWRDAWLTDRAAHHLLKLLLTLLAALTAATAIGDAIWPHSWRAGLHSAKPVIQSRYRGDSHQKTVLAHDFQIKSGSGPASGHF